MAVAPAPPIMQKHVEALLGRLVTDPTLRAAFVASPARILSDLVEQGTQLTVVERDAIAATDPAALHTFAAALDPRLRRAARPVVDR
jgi:hypothetical protein